MYANKNGRKDGMSLIYEIKSIRKDAPADLSFFEESSLIKEYQNMLDKGLIKQRGYTLQTIDDKQRDVFEVSSTTTYRKP